MELTYLYLALALAAGAGIFLYFSPFRAAKKPKTDTLFTEALNAMVRGDKGRAVRLLRDVVKQDSDHIRAYLQLGNIMRDDHPQQAIKIHQSLTVRPNLSSELRVDIHRALANDYEQVGQNVKAKKEAEQVLTFEKRNLWALQFLVRIAETNQNWDEAASWTKQMQKVT